jgi:hypothetical protein
VLAYGPDRLAIRRTLPPGIGRTSTARMSRPSWGSWRSSTPPRATAGVVGPPIVVQKLTARALAPVANRRGYRVSVD